MCNDSVLGGRDLGNEVGWVLKAFPAWSNGFGSLCLLQLDVVTPPAEEVPFPSPFASK